MLPPFSLNLRALLLLQGISSKQLAALLVVSTRSVTRWLTGGVAHLNPCHLNVLCEEFDLVPSDIEAEADGLAARLAHRLVASGWDTAAAGLGPRARVGWLREAFEGQWHGEVPLPVACPTVPLMSEGEAIGEVEVPLSLARLHPRAFAVGVRSRRRGTIRVVGNALSGRRMVALVDPEMRQGSGSVVLALRGDEQVLCRASELEGSEVQGVVVWFQPEDELK